MASLIHFVRRILTIAALSLGPASMIIGSLLAGRWPDGVEWIDTVILMPLISIVASGAVLGLFAAAEHIHRRLWPQADPDESIAP